LRSIVVWGSSLYRSFFSPVAPLAYAFHIVLLLFEFCKYLSQILQKFLKGYTIFALFFHFPPLVRCLTQLGVSPRRTRRPSIDVDSRCLCVGFMSTARPLPRCSFLIAFLFVIGCRSAKVGSFTNRYVDSSPSGYIAVSRSLAPLLLTAFFSLSPPVKSLMNRDTPLVETTETLVETLGFSLAPQPWCSLALGQGPRECGSPFLISLFS